MRSIPRPAFLLAAAPVLLPLLACAGGRGDSRSAGTRELFLRFAARVQGRVVDPDGVPVAGARIQQDLPDGFLYRSGGGPQTGADGRFTLETGTPEIVLTASAAAWCASEPVALVLGDGEER